MMDTFTDELKNKIDSKTKPPGSLGRLEEIALQIGQIQHTLQPVLRRPTIMVFAADHGLSREGVSPYPREVTAQMVLNFLRGGAAINVFCRQNGLELYVVDAGVDYDFNGIEGLIDAKIARGTRNMLKEPAMDRAQCLAAIQKGKELVSRIYHQGCNIIGLGEMGIGNTSSASLLVHRLLNLPLNLCTGRGTGLDDEGVKRKLQILEQVSASYPVKEPLEVLSTFGGFEIAMMTGAMMEAASLGMVIMVDGFIASAAAVCAMQLYENENILKNCIFCHESAEAGHQLVLQRLGVTPLLHLGMRLGEGTGAAMAYPVIRAAVAFLNEMASFESAGVASKR